MVTLDYASTVQAVVDAFPDHVFSVLNGWAPVVPYIVGIGVLLMVIRRAMRIA